MLSSLRRLLGHEPAKPEVTPRLAVAQLLLEMARADFAQDAAEIATIRDLLSRAYSLSTEEIDGLLAQAGERVARSISLYDAVNVVNAALGHDERRELLKMLWLVAYADGKLDKYEEALLRKLADLLFVSHSDFIREKLTVIGKHGPG